MRKFRGLVVALAVAMGVMLMTPGSSQAKGWRFFRRGYHPGWGYYRVGNVIINGRRWGDIGYRLSHADLVRW
jgi:hypothetical protein